MIRVLLVLFLFSTLSCTNNKGTSTESQKLYEDVMTIHDEVMPEMGTIRKLSKRLKKVDGADSNEVIQNALTRLDDAHETMMSWMAQFKMPKDISKEEEIQFLEKQMISVNDMKNTVLTAIENAESELAKHEDQ